MTQKKNARTLPEIADGIHKLERNSVFDIGDALLEAKSQCRHGEWLPWFQASNFNWGLDAAERYMKVAELGSKFRTLRNLKLAATTLYELARQDPKELPDIVKELTARATKVRLSTQEARRAIWTAIGRHRFGNHPEATLVQLANLDPDLLGDPWYDKAVAALKKQAPGADEAASAIVGKIDRERRAAEHKVMMDAFKRDLEAEHEAAEEAKAILDGAPPELPPPSSPSLEPQKLDADTGWAEADEFIKAIDRLRQLCTKPMARIAGKVASPVLRDMVDFLEAVIKLQDGASREPGTEERVP